MLSWRQTLQNSHMSLERQDLAFHKQELGKPSWPASQMNAILKILETNVQSGISLIVTLAHMNRPMENGNA